MHRYFLWVASPIIAIIGLVALSICLIKIAEGKALTRDNAASFLLLALFAAWVAIDVALHGYNSIAFSGLATIGNVLDGDSQITFIQNESVYTYLLYVFVYFGCAQFIVDDRLKKVIFRLNAIVSSLIAALAIAVFFSGYPAGSDVSLHGLSMCFWQFNHYGYYLCMMVMLGCLGFVFAEPGSWRKLYLTTFAINSYVLVLNDTFGAYLAMVFSLVVFAIFSKVQDKSLPHGTRLLALVILSATLIGGIQNNMFVEFGKLFTDASAVISNAEEAEGAGTGRWALWTATIEMMLDEPSSWLVGFGLDGRARELLIAANATRVHNEYLEKLSFFGIPGLALYLAAVASVYVKACKERETLPVTRKIALGVAFVYLVSAFFGVSMFYTAPFLYMFLGLGVNDNVQRGSSVVEQPDEDVGQASKAVEQGGDA